MIVMLGGNDWISTNVYCTGVVFVILLKCRITLHIKFHNITSISSSRLWVIKVVTIKFN